MKIVLHIPEEYIDRESDWEDPDESLPEEGTHVEFAARMHDGSLMRCLGIYDADGFHEIGVWSWKYAVIFAWRKIQPLPDWVLEMSRRIEKTKKK